MRDYWEETETKNKKINAKKIILSIVIAILVVAIIIPIVLWFNLSLVTFSPSDIMTIGFWK